MKSLQTRTTTFHSTPIVRGFLNQKYSELSKASDKFTDPLFPPEETSLYSTKSDHKDYEPPEIPKFLLDTSKNKFLSQFALSNKEDKLLRSLDMVEMDIRQAKGNENFRIDQCVDYMKVNFGVQDARGHEFVFTRMKCYE